MKPPRLPKNDKIPSTKSQVTNKFPAYRQAGNRPNTNDRNALVIGIWILFVICTPLNLWRTRFIIFALPAEVLVAGCLLFGISLSLIPP